MKKRKLIGANNIKIRENTFMEGVEVELQGYENVYAVDTDGVLTTLREIFIKNKLYDSKETTENPYTLDFQFVENGEWENVSNRSNSNFVKEKIREHILDYFDNVEKLKKQIDYMKLQKESVWDAGVRLCEGGTFLVYNNDIVDFLNSLNLKNKRYLKDGNPLRYYSQLIGREIQYLYKTI